MRDAITYPCLRYLFLVPKSSDGLSFVLLCFDAVCIDHILWELLYILCTVSGQCKTSVCADGVKSCILWQYFIWFKPKCIRFCWRNFSYCLHHICQFGKFLVWEFNEIGCHYWCLTYIYIDVCVCVFCEMSSACHSIMWTLVYKLALLLSNRIWAIVRLIGFGQRCFVATWR